MNKDKVAAIVVTFNRKVLLKECLEALLGQPSDIMPDIFVIDNASTDGTKEYIDDLLAVNDNMYYYNTGANLGGAGGFSYGIRVAVETGRYDYVWIMDDDTMAHEDSLAKLLEARDELNNDFGFLASAVLWTDGNYCRMNHVLLKNSPEWQEEFQNVAKGLIPINKATFVSLFIKTEAVLKVGLPIKEFFIWGDDQEYTDRIKKEFNCYFVPKSTVTHKMKTNNGSWLPTDELGRIDRYYYAYRNDWYTARRNGKEDKFGYYMFFLKTWKAILLQGKEKKGKRVRILFKGFMHGWRFHPEIEYVTIKK